MQLETARTSIGLWPLQPSDHAACVQLWATCDGVATRTWEDVAALHELLSRNPGLCWAAHYDGRLVATVLYGHDGWRGWLYHVSVAPALRRRGIATALVVRAQTELARRNPSRPRAGLDWQPRCGTVLERSRLANARGPDRGQRRDGGVARELGRRLLKRGRVDKDRR